MFHRPHTQVICTNCNESGHTSKHCTHPITSYGVIAFRVKGGWNQSERLCLQDPKLWESIQDRLEFLMIQRKDSIGYVEVMRGKYRTTDIPYLKQHLEGMTPEEHQKLLTRPFDALWEDLWGPPQEGSHAYKHEKEIARQKLDAIRTGSPSLKDLIAQCVEIWPTPEWGFPKGRKDLHETEYACAMREMWEETNLAEKDVMPVRSLMPLCETFLGTNGVQYCHKYFLVYVPEAIAERVGMTPSPENVEFNKEIGNIGWYSLDQAIGLLRSEHIKKKEVLLRAHSLLRNYYPIITKPPAVTRQAKTT